MHVTCCHRPSALFLGNFAYSFGQVARSVATVAVASALGARVTALLTGSTLLASLLANASQADAAGSITAAWFALRVALLVGIDSTIGHELSGHSLDLSRRETSVQIATDWAVVVHDCKEA